MCNNEVGRRIFQFHNLLESNSYPDKESSEINLCFYGQLIFSKGVKNQRKGIQSSF